MSTLASLPREVLKWLLSLDLSYTVRHIKRDFSNGFLFAEILCRYYPLDIQMHSFENVTSIERKRANWVVLEKLFKRRNIPIDQQQIEAIISAEGNAASEVLQAIYSFINSDAYRDSFNQIHVQQSSTPNPGHSRSHSCNRQQHVLRHSSPGRSKSNSRGAEVPVAGYCYGADGRMYPAYAAGPEAQMWQQLLYQQQAILSGDTKNVDPAFMQQMQAYAQMVGALGVAPDGTLLAAPQDGSSISSPSLDELAFTKKPRTVEFQPYTLSDYEARNYDVKKAAGYWQLGKMGPTETEELQAKREAKERVKALSQRISAANAELLAAALPAKPKPKEPTARQRAVEYAKNSVPRPELFKQRSGAGARSASGSRSRNSRTGSEAGSNSGADEMQEGSRMEQLEQQHEFYAQQVEQIRQELERSLGSAER